MQIGVIGIGRMGAGMARRLLASGHQVIVFDQDPVASARLALAPAATSIAQLVGRLERPRTIWVMVPPGTPTDAVFSELAQHLQPGDAVADGGNTHYRDSIQRAQLYEAARVDFIDVGTNSGVDGEDRGYCLSVGGSQSAVDRFRPMLDALGPGDGLGWKHVGPAGSGHFVKMVHNAVLYGLLGAYAEGFALLEGHASYLIDLPSVAELWSQGSLLHSTLLDFTAGLLARNRDLTDVEGSIGDTGAGRWGVLEAMEMNVSTPILVEAVLRRIRSRERAPYADRLVAALRGEFGGHEVPQRQLPAC